MRSKYGFYKNSRIPEGRKLAEGTIPGKIYPLGGRVPGVRLDNLGSADTVVGEVVEVNDKELAILDQLEAGYRRVRVTVTTAEGPMDAEVYEIRHNPRTTPVASGDWADFMEEYDKTVNRSY